MRCDHASLAGSSVCTAVDLPGEDILGRVESRISTAPISVGDRQFLLTLFRELQERIEGLRFPLAPASTRGDAHSELSRSGPASTSRGGYAVK